MKKYMLKALEIAMERKGYTSPNPMVGAVLVKNNRIIAEGSHQKAGMPHAEVIAIKNAGNNAKDSTLFVTLEPCCHFGRTPPCTGIIIKSGIKKVVGAMIDPNPKVNGKGYLQLKQAGIEVITGVCKKEAEELNEVFIYNMMSQLPFVTMKAALSIDGKIAAFTGISKWISNELSRNLTHTLRSHSDAVMIGKKTFLKDNPALNVRDIDNASDFKPYKIIVSKKLDFDAEVFFSSNIYKNSADKKIIVTVNENYSAKSIVKKLSRNGIKIVIIPSAFEDKPINYVLRELLKFGITSILLEGGSQLFTLFIKERLIQKVHLFHAPVFLGNEGISVSGNLDIDKPSNGIWLKNVSYRILDKNVCTTGYF